MLRWGKKNKFNTHYVSKIISIHETEMPIKTYREMALCVMFFMLVTSKERARDNIIITNRFVQSSRIKPSNIDVTQRASENEAIFMAMTFKWYADCASNISFRDAYLSKIFDENWNDLRSLWTLGGYVRSPHQTDEIKRNVAILHLTVCWKKSGNKFRHDKQQKI